MIITVSIYKEIYDYNAGFMTLRKVETITGTEPDIRKRFDELMKKYPTQRFHYIME